ncbi:MAG: hypothetical protein ACRDYA_14795 [Egibacteraceae bacterium]
MTEETIAERPPRTGADHDAAGAHLEDRRPEWAELLHDGKTFMAERLAEHGYEVISVQTAEPLTAQSALEAPATLLQGRLKKVGAILGKMRRFGEPLSAMLDIWGYRLITPGDLDKMARIVAGMWETPSDEELRLRNGAMQFAWWRDYRLKDHVGLSPFTARGYDDAVHINRRAPFGIVEAQVMTADLYRRAHCEPGREERHEGYVRRRAEGSATSRKHDALRLDV